MLSAYLMFRRFMSAVRVAARDDCSPYVAGAAALLVVIGTLTYSVSQDWSLVDGFHFAVATLTTPSASDPDLVLEGAPIRLSPRCACSWG